LKNKEIQKPDYTDLKKKIYLQITMIVISAIIAVATLRILVNNTAGNLIVSIFQRIFNIDWYKAHDLYTKLIRNNLDFIIYLTFAIFFIILSRFLLSKFEKYFSEISVGLESLATERNDEIKLSSEMFAMERKLNTIKHTLEERKQEAKLAEQRKNDVVMYLAHDIKTPLTSVIGYLSLLDEAQDMPIEQKAKYVKISLDKAYRLEKLVDEFFEITRFNFQADALLKENIDLYYMLMQMTDEFYPLLNTKGKQAVLNVPEDIYVYGDPNKLARVFNNLLKNALAYSPDNSIINITATVSNSIVSIIFENNGSIPKDKLDSIFEKFYRLDSSRSSNTGGVGVGLAIAKEIVILHGGKIYADSDEKQTIFTVELPVFSE
jgi:two-component system sensor histidine kinase VanS